MKKLFTLLVFIITLTISAQAPQGFNYQATVRNSAGALITNQIVGFKFSIKQTSASGTTVYSETQNVSPDNLGQVSLVVGTGTPSTGTFAAINWASGTYYLAIELNTGAGFVAMGTTQLLSVPYALYANSSGNSQPATPSLAAVLAVNNGANSLQIKNIANPTDAQDAVTKSFSEAQLQAQVAQLQAQIDALIKATITPLPNVTIGTQTWTSKNLDVTTYSDGTVIPQVTDPTQWTKLTTGAWCYYNNDPAINPTYGKLYNWYAVAGIHDNDPNTPNKMLAPQGWHVPNSSEWSTLINYLGGLSIAGGKMKETGTTHWFSPNTGATNVSGFTALPNGIREFNNGDFYLIGDYGHCWSRDENNSVSSFAMWNKSDKQNSNLGTTEKVNGIAVRCVRD